MAALEFLLAVAGRFGEIIISPAKNFDMLWILIPIYINWIFTDLYQERKGTDFGNAITNGVVALWVGLDWIRQTTKAFEFNELTMTKIAICALFIIYGIIVMVESARGKKIAHYIGRIRELTYFAIVATPIFYGIIKPDIITLAAILIFLPIFYGFGELLDRIIPGLPEEEPGGDMSDIGLSKGAGGLEMPATQAMPEMPQMPPMGKI